MTIPRRATDGRLDCGPRAATEVPPSPAGVTPLDLGSSVEALLAVPAGEPGPWPLLVFFDGAGGNSVNSLSALGDLASARGVLVLAPTSAGSTWDLLTGGLGRDVSPRGVLGRLTRGVGRPPARSPRGAAGRRRSAAR